MSLHLDFEPHSWYMGFAIRKAPEPINPSRILWEGFTENGNTYSVDTTAAYTLKLLKERIRAYHVQMGDGYGERILARRAAQIWDRY